MSPAPGPISNLRLVKEDHESKKWVARPKLTMATATRGGDYRRITKEAWEMYQQLYPHSGPTITAKFDKVCRDKLIFQLLQYNLKYLLGK